MGFIASKNEKINNEIINNGNISELDQIYPTCIDFRSPKQINIDGKFVTSLLIVDYAREMDKAFLDKLVSLEIDLNISMFYEKQNSYQKR